MASLIDISQTLTSNLPVWPGDTPFACDTHWEMGPTCPVLVSRLTLSTHSGTHADAPSHYDPSGNHMAETGLVPYLGPCHVVHATNAAGPVTVDQTLPALEELGGIPERVLIRTFDNFPHTHWPVPFKAIDADLIRILAEKGCLLIGTDTPSLDPETSKTMDAHIAIKNANMSILEGLVLDHVSVGRYELIALPLKIENADASPVRAVLRSIEDDI